MTSAFGAIEFLAAQQMESQEKTASQRSREGLNEAIYDVRERFGSFLNDAEDMRGFKDRLAMVKDDMMKAVDKHLMPVSGVMNKVTAALRDDFKKKTAGAWEESDGDPYNKGYNGGKWLDEKEQKKFQEELKRPVGPKQSSQSSSCAIKWLEAPGEDPQHREAYPLEDCTLSVEPNGELWSWEVKDGTTTAGSGDSLTPDQAQQDAETCFKIEVLKIHESSHRQSGVWTEDGRDAGEARSMGGRDYPHTAVPHWDQGDPDVPGSLNHYEDWVDSVSQDPTDWVSRQEYEGFNGPIRDYDKKYRRGSHFLEGAGINDAPELENEGDFHDYLDSVDDNAEQKIDHNFIGEGHPHDGDPAKTLFADRRTADDGFGSFGSGLGLGDASSDWQEQATDNLGGGSSTFNNGNTGIAPMDTDWSAEPSSAGGWFDQGQTSNSPDFGMNAVNGLGVSGLSAGQGLEDEGSLNPDGAGGWSGQGWLGRSSARLPMQIQLYSDWCESNQLPRFSNRSIQLYADNVNQRDLHIITSTLNKIAEGQHRKQPQWAESLPHEEPYKSLMNENDGQVYTVYQDEMDHPNDTDWNVERNNPEDFTNGVFGDIVQSPAGYPPWFGSQENAMDWAERQGVPQGGGRHRASKLQRFFEGAELPQTSPSDFSDPWGRDQFPDGMTQPMYDSTGHQWNPQAVQSSRRNAGWGDYKHPPAEQKAYDDWKSRTHSPEGEYLNPSEREDSSVFQGPSRSPMRGEKPLSYDGSRRQAVQDERALLEKADQALTDLLNNRAEVFQETLSPIQQALQAVQYAEAVEQAANPLNVMPPAGTVDVMPQTQDPGAPPQLNMPPVGPPPPGTVDPMAGVGGGDPLLDGLAAAGAQKQSSQVRQASFIEEFFTK